MTDYTKAKIYMMSCPNKFYYYGSTCSTLVKRKSWHKAQSVKFPNRKAYKHFDEVGWKLIKIELIEEPKCEELVDLLRAEDKYLKEHLDKELCLNMQRAYLEEGESQKYHNEKQARWRLNNPEQAKENLHKYRQTDQAKEAKKTHNKTYRENNKESISQGKKDWALRNAEQVKESRKGKYAKNQESAKQYSNNYYAENKDEINKRRREKAAQKRKDKKSTPERCLPPPSPRLSQSSEE